MAFTLCPAKLMDICARHSYSGPDAVVPEPYVPHFPKPPADWNGILVLATAQNLSDRNIEYRHWLRALKPEDRRNRLNLDGIPLNGIGIGPWDDGTIKLCVAALRGADAVGRVAVSNAVLWSGSRSGKHESLSEEMKAASVAVWAEMLQSLNPAEVIAFGADAREMMKRVGVPARVLAEMPGPFSRSYNVGFRMDTNRLLAAFPEVDRARRSLLSAVPVDNEAMAINCACACVSQELGRR